MDEGLRGMQIRVSAMLAGGMWYESSATSIDELTAAIVGYGATNVKASLIERDTNYAKMVLNFEERAVADVTLQQIPMHQGEVRVYAKSRAPLGVDLNTDNALVRFLAAALYLYDKDREKIRATPSKTPNPKSKTVAARWRRDWKKSSLYSRIKRAQH